LNWTKNPVLIKVKVRRIVMEATPKGFWGRLRWGMSLPLVMMIVNVAEGPDSGIRTHPILNQSGAKGHWSRIVRLSCYLRWPRIMILVPYVDEIDYQEFMKMIMAEGFSGWRLVSSADVPGVVETEISTPEQPAQTEITSAAGQTALRTAKTLAENKMITTAVTDGMQPQVGGRLASCAFWVLLFLFIGLRVSGAVTWSWWLVLTPLWVWLAVVAAVIGLSILLSLLWPEEYAKWEKAQTESASAENVES
jgi:hypothetical protein